MGQFDSDAFYPPLQYLPSLVLKASMPDTKGCYTPMGDTGIHLNRYWKGVKGSRLRVQGSRFKVMGYGGGS